MDSTNSKPTRRIPTPARIIAQMIEKAQEIMEQDALFMANLKSLNQRTIDRKVPASQWRHIRQAIVGDCLRRQGFPLSDARLLLRHGV